MKKPAKANKKIVLSDYPVDAPEDVLEFYPEVFSGYKGRWVLVHMLKDLYFFDEIINSDEELFRANYARKLLSRIGIWEKLNPKDFIDALFKARGK